MGFNDRVVFANPNGAEVRDRDHALKFLRVDGVYTVQTRVDLYYGAKVVLKEHPWFSFDCRLFDDAAPLLACASKLRGWFWRLALGAVVIYACYFVYLKAGACEAERHARLVELVFYEAMGE